MARKRRPRAGVLSRWLYYNRMSDEIPWRRECDCPDNHVSCLSAKEWVKRQIGIWRVRFCKSDIRDKSVHPATFPVELANMVITTFTHAGELVLDPFVGSGTTALSCAAHERSCVGVDLNPEYVEVARKRMPPPSMHSGAQTKIIEGDSRNVASMVAPGTVKLLFTSPPYSLSLSRKKQALSSRQRKKHGEGKDWRYSDDPMDLGNLAPEEFKLALDEVLSSAKPTLRKDAHVVINIGDLYMDGKFYPLHAGVIEAATSAGFSLRNTIIWDRLPLLNNTGIFGYPSNFITIGTSFEYLLHFVPNQV